jgi:hypothetical protein
MSELNPGHPMRREFNRRQEDSLSFIRKNWGIILAIVGTISGYSVLAYSVKEHHTIDAERCARYETNLALDNMQIATLQEAVKSIPRIEGKVDRILERMVVRK